jgi:hypothetical protein
VPGRDRNPIQVAGQHDLAAEGGRCLVGQPIDAG